MKEPESVLPADEEAEKAKLSPKSLAVCLAMTIPALFAGKLMTIGLFIPGVEGFYRGAHLEPDAIHYFLTHVFSCTAAGFVFVWVGTLTPRGIRWFSVWFFTALAVLGGVLIVAETSMPAFIGQCIGAMTAGILVRNNFPPLWKKIIFSVVSLTAFICATSIISSMRVRRSKQQVPIAETRQSSFPLVAPQSQAVTLTVAQRAQKGDADAQVQLGAMYRSGEGVPKDMGEAVKWFRASAEQGNADGQVALAIMFDQGDGVIKNEVEALKWYRKAAEQGHSVAQFGVGFGYRWGQGVPKDSAEAAKWYRRAAEQGHVSAQTTLGLMYQDGEGVPKDYAEAVKWYRKAAEQGNASAQQALGVMCYNGDGIPKDKVEAVKWYRKAAEQGIDSAEAYLGWMYSNGEGVPKDSVEAVKWYRLSAEQGNLDGQYFLGSKYFSGEGVPKDMVQTHVWWNIASANGDKRAKESLDMLEKLMTPEQKAEAMKLAKELWEKLPKK